MAKNQYKITARLSRDRIRTYITKRASQVPRDMKGEKRIFSKRIRRKVQIYCLITKKVIDDKERFKLSKLSMLSWFHISTPHVSYGQKLPIILQTR